MILDASKIKTLTEVSESESILDPITGELVDVNDADSLIDAYQRLDAHDKEVYAAKRAIKLAIAALTTGEAKTRRVRGESGRNAVVTMPDDSWDQSKLKEAWNSYPKFRDEFLAISELRVQMREFKKTLNTSSSDEAFSQFQKMLIAANKGPSPGATPSVKIEEAR